jgi:hypothetical protein
VRAELVCEPICTLEERTGTVKVIFSFAMIDAAGQLVELSWEDTRAQETGKRLGGTSRCLAQAEDVPVPFEVRMPSSLFLESGRIDLKLRTMKPLRSLGHGSGTPGADPEDLSGTVHFKLRRWTDLT